MKSSLDPTAYHGRFDLTGPDEMTMDDFVLALNSNREKMRHIHPRFARALGHVVAGLTPALVDILLADSLGDRTRAVRTFGLEQRHIEDVYPTRSAAAA